MIKHTSIVSIVGNIVSLEVAGLTENAFAGQLRLGDLSIIDSPNRSQATAQIIRLKGDLISLQVFGGTNGISTASTVSFPGQPLQVTYSANVLGRIFDGAGKPRDGLSGLDQDNKVPVAGPNINPVRRVLASKLIRTNIPMIDLFNSLVESQKLPIFTAAGEPYNQLLARIGSQADADIIIFGGIALLYDDYHYFRTAFENSGASSRTVMFTHLASDPVAEALLVPDMALALAERFAVEESKRVLVLLTDMTAFADALKEVAISMEQIPSNRGYTGDLYSQLARRYEKACDFRGAGSVTILGVTTMPGDDITHPVPDNTGYITEGQYYLRDGLIDPFASLSRLKQMVVGKVTREDHAQVMSAMIRLYSEAVAAERKQAMAFDLGNYDKRLLEFAKTFRKELLPIDVNLTLEQALDLCWVMMADYFDPVELLIKQELIDEYFPIKENLANTSVSEDIV
ncbi:MAG: V-type ATP synthase subunit B [Porticoccus sp.]